jgi:gluconolactonase
MMSEQLFRSEIFTEPGGFTAGIEGPACDAEGNLYAVNYERQLLELPNGSIGNGIRFNRAGDMFIADYTNHTILKVDMRTRATSVYCHVPTIHQPNDLAITSGGDLYASDPDWKNSKGQLWRIDTDGGATLLEQGMGTTNGIEVSPDEQILYVNETVQRTIWAYDRSSDGSLSRKRLLIQFPDFALDGMRCDVAGNLYVTRYEKGTVAMVSPSGEVLREIQLAGKQPTNLTFGGPDGCTCYVTIADRGNIEAFRTELPGRCWQLHNIAAARKTGVIDPV